MIGSMKVSEIARKIQFISPIVGNVKVRYKEACKLARVMRGEKSFEELPSPMKLYFAQVGSSLVFRNIKENKPSNISLETEIMFSCI